jgi:hypothetical protein
MCREFLQSGQCNNPGCRYAHSEVQLRTTETFFKTKVCRFAARGRCKHGQACRFAHNAGELTIIAEDNAQGVDEDLNDQQNSPQNYPLWAMNGSEPGGNGSGSDSNFGGSGGGGSGDAQFVGGRDGGSQQGSGNSDQSTRADTTAQVSTPEGSGDSGQEENHLSQFLNQGSRRRNQNDEGRRQDRRAVESSSGRHCTTMMLTNVPSFLTQGALVSLLEDLTKCVRGTFDFFYCPWDPYQDRNLGYAIVNFFSRAIAADFERQWSNKHLLAGCRGSKRLRIMPAALQGRANNIRHFSGFSLASHADPRFRPLIRAGPGEPLRPMAVAPEMGPQASSSQEAPQMPAGPVMPTGGPGFTNMPMMMPDNIDLPSFRQQAAVPSERGYPMGAPVDFDKFIMGVPGQERVPAAPWAAQIGMQGFPQGSNVPYMSNQLASMLPVYQQEGVYSD